MTCHVGMYIGNVQLINEDTFLRKRLFKEHNVFTFLLQT